MQCLAGAPPVRGSSSSRPGGLEPWGRPGTQHSVPAHHCGNGGHEGRGPAGGRTRAYGERLVGREPWAIRVSLMQQSGGGHLGRSPLTKRCRALTGSPRRPTFRGGGRERFRGASHTRPHARMITHQALAEPHRFGVGFLPPVHFRSGPHTQTDRNGRGRRGQGVRLASPLQ